MNPTSDVVVIGAGVMGCSVAFHLAERGMAVCVLDKGGIAAGGTGLSSAIIRQHYSNELTARMALHSLRVFQDFGERVGGECGFRRTGWLGLAAPRHRAGMEANVALQRGVGIETDLLSPEELDDLLPGVEVSDVAVAAYEPGSGYADPHLTTTAYADAARRLGATFRLNCEVTGVRMRGGRVVGVDTVQGPVDAPLVVNCAGPWGARVARMCGVEVPIQACRVQVAVFRRPPAFAFEAPHPVVIDFVTGTYFRAETGRLTLVGSVDPAEANDVVDPDDYAEHVDDAFVADVGGKFVHRCPPMQESQVTRGYAGPYAVTPDWHPIVDQVPEGSGCFCCSGFSGHGFKLGPAVGLMVADLVTETADPAFPAAPFGLRRFAEGRPIRGRYEYSITG